MRSSESCCNCNQYELNSVLVGSHFRFVRTAKSRRTIRSVRLKVRHGRTINTVARLKLGLVCADFKMVCVGGIIIETHKTRDFEHR